MSKNKMSKNVKPSKRARARFLTFKSKIENSLELPKLEDEDRAFIKALCGYGNPYEATLASDMTLRWEGARALKNAMLAHRHIRPESKRNYYFGTLVDDCGITSDRAPIVRLSELKQKAYRVLKASNLDALAVIEVHPLMNYPGGGQGRSLLWHVHFLTWADEPIDYKALADEINASSAWSCRLGAAPAVIEEIDGTKRDLASVCFYLIKPPHSVKNRMPSNDDPDKHLLMDTVKGFRPEFALRVAETYSQIELPYLIFGVNGGAHIRQSVKEAI